MKGARSDVSKDTVPSENKDASATGFATVDDRRYRVEVLSEKSRRQSMNADGQNRCILMNQVHDKCTLESLHLQNHSVVSFYGS